MKTILIYLFGLIFIFIISSVLNFDKEMIYYSIASYSFIMLLDRLDEINKNLKK